ncbi:MAG: PDGLE domain-containing protein, partial [Planctomycetes bacterium]|nr:PDGLE domain-containing protein [Planctomycetota bacterium]
FNMGFWTCFVMYPLVYKKIVGQHRSQSKLFWGSMIAAVVGLQLGAFNVVLQTVLSGISELPFAGFLAAMQPIHLGIGIVEGFITAGVVAFVAKAQPQLLEITIPQTDKSPVSIKLVAASLLIAAAITGGALSWFASAHPDGLEWSMFKTSGTEELDTPENPVYDKLSGLQETTAFLPDYGFKESEAAVAAEETDESWPAVDVGTTISGLVGGLLTLALAFGIGFLLKFKWKI